MDAWDVFWNSTNNANLLNYLPPPAVARAAIPGQAQQALDEPTQQGIIRGLAAKGVGALAALGNVLDLPGSSVRDVLAGQNPLDQWLSPTGFQNRVSGRDLLRKYGFAGRRDTWGNFLGGLGAEILTDPLSFVGVLGRGFTPVGKAIQKAGLYEPYLAAKMVEKGIEGPAQAARAATLKDFLNVMGETGRMDDLARALGQVVKRDVTLPELDLLRQTAAAGGQAPLAATDLTALLHEPLSKKFRLTAPFYGDIKAFDIPGVSERLERGYDAARALGYKTPGIGDLMLLGNRWFRPEVRQARTAAGQAAGRLAHLNEAERLAQAGAETSEVMRKLQDAGVLDLRTPKGQERAQSVYRYLTRQTDMQAQAAAPLREFMVNLTKENDLTKELSRMKKLLRQRDGSLKLLEYTYKEATPAVKQAMEAAGIIVKQATPAGQVIQINRGALPFGSSARKNFAADWAINKHLATTGDIIGPNGKVQKALAQYAPGIKESHLQYNKLFAQYEPPTSAIAPGPVIRSNFAPPDVWARALLEHGTRPGNLKYQKPVQLARKNLGVLKQLGPVTKEEMDYRTAAGILPPELLPHEQTLQKFREVFDKRLPSEDYWLVGGKNLNDAFSLYYPGALTPLETGKIRGVSDKSVRNLADFYNPAAQKRGEVPRNLMGGYELLNKLSTWKEELPATAQAKLPSGFLKDQSKLMSGLAHRIVDKAEIDLIVDDVAEEIRNSTDGFGALIGGSPEYKARKSRQLAKWLMTRDPIHAEQGIPRYAIDPLESLQRRVDYGVRAESSSKIALQTLGELVQTTPTADQALITVGDALKQLYPTTTATKRLERMNSMLKPGLQTPDLNKLANYYVPREMVNDMQRVMHSFTQPEEANWVLNAIDKFTALFKTSVTTPWPNFHVRNFTSAYIQNAIVGGMHDPRYSRINPLRYIMPVVESLNLLQGRTIKGIAQHPWFKSLKLTDEEAMAKLRELVFSHSVKRQGQGWVADIGKSRIRERAAKVVGAEKPMSLRQSIFQTPGEPGASLASQLNPLSAENFALYRWGGDIGEFVEGVNRIAPFIAFGREGLSPTEAARRVKMLQVDYGALTVTERAVMRRMFPFYAYTRRVLPATFQELMTHTEGPLRQFLRVPGKAQSQDQFMPEHVSRQTAIDLTQTPLGRNLPAGTNRYLTSLGLMFEDPLELVAGGFMPGVRKLASMSNPLFKLAAETVTGKSMFMAGPQGFKDLEDLDPTIGRILRNIEQLTTGDKDVTGRYRYREAVRTPQWLETLAMNLPTSKALTTLRQITDPRKLQAPLALPLNIFTGFRVVDVSEAARQKELAARLDLALKEFGAKDIPIMYFTPEQIAKNPALALLQAYRNRLSQEARQAAKERRAGKS